MKTNSFIKLFIIISSAILNYTISSAQSQQPVIGDAKWGFKFDCPEGWRYEMAFNGAMLTHDSIKGTILVMPHKAKSYDAVKKLMEIGISQKGNELKPCDTIIELNDHTIGGDYSGLWNNKNVKARCYGAFNANGGGGAFIFGISKPDEYSDKLKETTEKIARELFFFPAHESKPKALPIH